MLYVLYARSQRLTPPNQCCGDVWSLGFTLEQMFLLLATLQVQKQEQSQYPGVVARGGCLVSCPRPVH